MRLLVGVLLVCCLLVWIAWLGAQTSSANAPLALTLSVPDRSGHFRLVLQNRSAAAVHVLLGFEDGSRRECLDAFSLLFAEPGGRTHKLVPICFPTAGTISLLEPVIAPDQDWHGDVDLKMFMVYDDPINPISVEDLASGSYSITATFDGRKPGWFQHGRPYWIGTIRSKAVQYTLSK
jgi:hypothetical protein